MGEIKLIHTTSLVKSSPPASNFFKYNMIIKNNIKKIRKEKNITVAQLATTAGCHHTHISGIENNHWKASNELELLIAKALDEPVENVFYAVSSNCE
jgi:putative transcriptional regulator